jgi:muramoyltetrapeptide carboxypeptidase
MVKTPAYLNHGDTIGIICPAGYMPQDKVQSCIDTLKEWGYNVRTGVTVGSLSVNYFSGTDAERLDDFQQMLDDDTVHAVLCARGGYGLGRIIDSIDFKKFKSKPKWIIGFSDITLLHCHIYSNYKIATLHAPMAGAFNDPDKSNEYLLSLKNALTGKKISYQSASHPFNRKGEITGELIGGNLALLAHCIGTPSDFKTKGKILFIEDVGEYLYNIDRMLYQLKRAGKFDKLGGLIVGGFSNSRDTDRPFGSSAEEIIRDTVKDYDFPVCFGFPISHEKENLAVKVGVGYEFSVYRNGVSLEE